MGGFFSRIRSGAGRAAFEADKQRRIMSVQATLRGLRQQVEQAMQGVGKVTMDLYHAGRLDEPELQQVCQETAALQAEVAAQERQVESIRQEVYEDSQRGPTTGAAVAYGDVCPNGHGALPEGAKFCPVCGAPKVYRPPPAAGSVCSSCGASLVPEASFCPSCGAAVPQPVAPPPATPQPAIPQPVAPSPATPQPAIAEPSVPQSAIPQPVVPQPVAPQPVGGERACPNCGRGVLPEATFCGQCGHPIGVSAPSEELPAAVTAPAVDLGPEPAAGTAPEPVTAPETVMLPPDELEPAAAPETVVLPPDELEPAAGPETVVLPPDELELAAGPETVVLPPDELEPVAAPETRPLSDSAPQPGALQEGVVSEPAAPDALRLCSTCGTPLAPDATFCPECGRTVSPVQEPPDAAGGAGAASQCLNCGAMLIPEAMFCPECGRPRAANPIDDGGSVAPRDG